MENIKTIIIWVTGILLALVLALSIAFWMQNQNSLPQQPHLSVSTYDSVHTMKTKEIANYKELLLIVETQREKSFDLVITKTLLPILNTLLAAVITYILATTGKELLNSFINPKHRQQKEC